MAKTSTLAPFRHRLFLMVWIASLASNFGSMIQSVGASWAMTSLAESADMVALVQSSTTLPIMLFALLAGALADVFDRRAVMLSALMLMLVASTMLALFAYLGHIGPWTLLAFTFTIGCGTALWGPAWQAAVGEYVPREDVPGAVALNSVGFNVARSLGPAIGGVIVAAAGPALAFAVNAISYIGLIVVLLSWKREKLPQLLPPEGLVSAMRTGIGYVRHAPTVRAVLARSIVFGVAGAGIWALQPLVARDLLGGGPLTYGLLLGAFGVGAVMGALVSTRVRQRLNTEAVTRIAALMFGLAVLAAAMSRMLSLTMAALLVAGTGWVIGLSTFNITIQLATPRWVVGRAMAIYQMVTFGGMAVGSWMWGHVAEWLSLSMALIISGTATITGTLLLGTRMPLADDERVDLGPSRKWAEGDVHADPDRASGPIVVTVEYRVPQALAAQFVAAMADKRRIRRRDGARQWSLLQDMDDPERWVERFQSPSWIEHLRQYHRATVADRTIEERILAFHKGPEPPRVRHMMAHDPGAVEPVTPLSMH